MNQKDSLDKRVDLPEKFVLTDEFKNIFDQMENTKKNLFITGKAGCGKSTLLEYFRQKTKKNFAVLSFTGLASLRVRGNTIHSFFKFPPRFIRQYDPDIRLHRNPAVLKNLDTIIIDECSAVRADLLDAIDESLKKNRKNEKIFGGVQIILIGDLLQLAPITGGAENESIEKTYPDGAFFFNARVFNSAKFKTLELTKIFRQSDEFFIDLLNKFRLAKVEDEDLDFINTRFVGEDFETPEGVIQLSTVNSKVDKINEDKLNKIKSKSYTYTAQIKDKFKREMPAPETLVLKVGAQVMCLANEKEQKWVNGTIAIVKELNEKEIKIGIGDKIYLINKFQWEQYEYDCTGSVVIPKIVGRYIQFPLKLAWAATIHKCQGQTFKDVVIDMDRGSFCHGQTYVALSRATSIEGIHLKREINRGDLVFDKRVFNFLGTELEKKYITEIDSFRGTSKKNVSEVEKWSTKDEKKLISLYKKKVPEIALARILNKTTSEVRHKILELLKFN